MSRKIAGLGPFKDAYENAEKFGYGLYYNYCFTNTLEALLQAQEEYDAAIEEQDTALMAVKKKEIMFYEEVVDVAMRAVAERISSPFSGSLHD